MATERKGCLNALLGIFRSGEVRRKGVQEIYPYRVRDDFLSPAEISFFHVLKSMTAEHMVVCPKVSLAELFFVSRGDSYQTYMNKIDRKRVDFLLCDPKTLKPVLAIELDDSSHERLNRQERDHFVDEVFAAAQLPLVRVPVRQSYNVNELAALFRSALQKRAADNRLISQPARPQATVPPTCPKCGIQMVLRTAKRGNTPGQQFYGCPNYPRCKVVIPLQPLAPDL